MSRKVIGPDILEDRLVYMRGKSVWYYIDVLNSRLQNGPVNEDGSIEIRIEYNIDTNLLEQVQSFYIGAGWQDVDIVLLGNAETLYGATIFTFIPPPVWRMKIKAMVARNL
jgi:hypothetical protein